MRFRLMVHIAFMLVYLDHYIMLYIIFITEMEILTSVPDELFSESFTEVLDASLAPTVPISLPTSNAAKVDRTIFKLTMELKCTMTLW